MVGHGQPWLTVGQPWPAFVGLSLAMAGHVRAWRSWAGLWPGGPNPNTLIKHWLAPIVTLRGDFGGFKIVIFYIVLSHTPLPAKQVGGFIIFRRAPGAGQIHHFSTETPGCGQIHDLPTQTALGRHNSSIAVRDLGGPKFIIFRQRPWEPANS